MQIDHFNLLIWINKTLDLDQSKRHNKIIEDSSWVYMWVTVK